MLVKTDRLVKTCSLRSNIINISQIYSSLITINIYAEYLDFLWQLFVSL